tara:strand:+ start:230 stop:2254 length:2025 start_codon:yes stop_codon:yes gene_type:complete
MLNYKVIFIMNRLYLTLSIILFFQFSSPVNAQISLDCNDNADQLVNYLVDGVAFSNATVSGFDCSMGYFEGEDLNIDIPSGIVMATGGLTGGFSSIVIDPGGTELQGGAGIDADLTQQLEIVGASATNLNDLIIIEFDFETTSDEIVFEYVFASLEYTGYTCSQFNDIFGFFLSGPGINGPFSNNAINLALVPDNEAQTSFTDSPVIINTINSGVPSGGDSTPCDDIDPNWEDYSVFFNANPDLEQINFNGFTVPLIATASVIPCETYHIKLAIADVSDGALNSGVFLAENSFSSVGISVNQQSDYSPYIGNDSTLVEGCMDGEIVFELSETINTNSVIDYVVSGTAESGVDYEDIGSQVIIPAGETSVTIPIVPLYDGIAEGMEDLVVTTIISDGCTEEERDYVFNFVDRMELYVDIPSDTAFCPGDDAIIINPYFSGGIFPIEAQWYYEGGLYSNEEAITILPENVGTYTFSAVDLCDSEVYAEIFTYILEPEEPLIISTAFNDLDVCIDDQVTTEVYINGGIGAYDIEWLLDGMLYSNSMNFDIPTDVPFDYNFIIDVSDDCSNEFSQEININVLDCFVPNVFTPNNDGVNDYWFIDVGDDVKNVRVKVYNRWGQLIYTSTHYELCDEETGEYCWNGKDMSENEYCPNGIYYYTVELKDGRNHKGSFSIFR